MSARYTELLKTLESCEALMADGKTETALKQLIALEEKKYRAAFLRLSNQYQTLNKQFRDGMISQEDLATRLNRVNASILDAIQKTESELKNKADVSRPENPPLKLILGAGAGLIVLFLGYWFFIRPAGKMDCSAGSKTAIHIAKFQENETTDGFSLSVREELKYRLEEDAYRVLDAGEQAFKELEYETIEAKFFQKSCDTSGLFLNGRWDTDQKYFICRIDAINLSLKVSDMETGDRPSITLVNPPGIQFSIQEDYKFLTNFILGLLKTYEGSTTEALGLFRQLEKDPILAGDDKLKAQVAFYKGSAYAMRGNQEQAEAEYRIAAAEPRLREIALENIRKASEIKAVMEKDPLLSEKRMAYIRQDSMMEIGERPVVLPEPGEPDDPEIAAEIDHQLKQEAQQSAKKAGEAEKTSDLATKDDQDDSILPEDKTSLNQPPVGADDGKNPVEPTMDKAVEKPEIVLEGGEKFLRFADKNWMTRNLNVDVDGSYCYGDEEGNCKKYGRLYTWEAAEKACKTLGPGWRLPTDEEWKALMDSYYGDAEIAYEALIDGGNSGFAALLGGWRNTDGSYGTQGVYGNYWSDSASYESNAWTYKFDNGKLSRYYYGKSYAFSVRCLQGAPSNGKD